jgi:hypothetical protein
MDEYNAEFQAQLLASGQIRQELPEAWRDHSQWILPDFIRYDPHRGTIASSYLPLYSGLRAAGLRVSAASVVNPAMAALAIVLVAAIAARLRPTDPSAPLLAALLLATSTQFLLTSMTAYSMPAHLCVNLLWLLLYLRSGDDLWNWPLLLLPWVGVAGLGLHNPFPHALFVAPFLVRILRTRRAPVVAYVGGVYLAGCLLWGFWLSTVAGFGGPSGAGQLFGLPDGLHLLTEAMSLTLILSWQTPVLILGAVVAVALTGRLSGCERDLAAGMALTCGFYFFFLSSQGHGWGYRYMYGVLGNLVLLGAAGLLTTARILGSGPVRHLVAASLLVSLAIQLPVRSRDAERFTRPFANASRALAQARAFVVVIPAADIWYGQDLIRNTPDLQPPIVVAASRTELAEQRKWLAEHFGDAVEYVRLEEMAALGLSTDESD